MNTIQYVNRVILPAAFKLLPDKMDSIGAKVELLTIGSQESRFKYRHQQGNGPAEGFFQFEEAGVNAVMRYPSTRPIILPLLATMGYQESVPMVQDALGHNDVLAAVFARLLLWTHPSPLPSNAGEGWKQYLDCWRPGAPRPQTWSEFYDQSLRIVQLEV